LSFGGADIVFRLLRNFFRLRVGRFWRCVGAAVVLIFGVRFNGVSPTDARFFKIVRAEGSDSRGCRRIRGICVRDSPFHHETFFRIFRPKMEVPSGRDKRRDHTGRDDISFLEPLDT
jgi:hypothetical protein